jgi:hypothetical protein
MAEPEWDTIRNGPPMIPRDLALRALDAEIAKRQEAERQITELEWWTDNQEGRLADVYEKFRSAEAEVQRLRADMAQAMRELGIPLPHYPAPAAKAWRILAAALGKEIDAPSEVTTDSGAGEGLAHPVITGHIAAAALNRGEEG